MNPRNQEVTEHERSTMEVLIAYRMSEFGYTDMPDDAPHDPEELAEVDAEFNNWLNEVRARAWDEATNTHDWCESCNCDTRANPYRKEEDA